MGQIITSLVNFILEMTRSGDRYKSRRNKGKTAFIFLALVACVGVYMATKSFTNAYVCTAEQVRLKRRIDELLHYERENAALQVRNEILSATLSMYIGKQSVEKINQGKTVELDDSIGQQKPAKPEIKPRATITPFSNTAYPAHARE